MPANSYFRITAPGSALGAAVSIFASGEDTLWPEDVTPSGGGYVTETVRDLNGNLHTIALPGEPYTLRIQGGAPHSIHREQAAALLALYRSERPFDLETDYLGPDPEQRENWIFAEIPVFRPLDDDGERYSYDMTIRQIE